MKTVARWGPVLVLILALAGSEALGQSRTGQILGTITDPTGAVIPGATVTITNQGTSRTRVITTDEAGRYLVPLLPVGKYTIKASSLGFAEAMVKDVVLEVQDSREVNLTLSLAAAEELVEVAAEVVALETTSATLGQVVHASQVSELPLDGRNFVQLGTLAPGANKGEGAFFNNRGNTEVSIRGTTSLSVQGMRENSNDWLLDGIDNNELTAGAISIMPSIDSVQEFKVLSFNYSAEYGSRGSATILVITKGGTNEFHGTVFDFMRNDALDARNFFDGEDKGKLRRHQFGGSLGGPIVKNKTFFFADYQGQITREGLTFIASVPTAAMRAGDFTEVFPDATTPDIYDPYSQYTDPVTGLLVRPQFPGNVIPPCNGQDPFVVGGCITPQGQGLVNLFPLPNIPGAGSYGNYRNNPVRKFEQDSFNVRIDHDFSDKDQIFGRFSYDDAYQWYPSGDGAWMYGPRPTMSTCEFRTHARNIAISHTHTFSMNKINQLTVGFNRVFNRMISFGQFNGGIEKATELGIPGANIPGDFMTSGLPRVGVSGFDALGDRTYVPFVGGTNVYHFTDSFLYTRGAHSMKMGGAVRLQSMPVVGNGYPRGRYNFNEWYTAGFDAAGELDGDTGHSVASLLIGVPASLSRNMQFTGWMTARKWQEYRFYFEDTWRVNSDFTWIMGVAYNVTTPITEEYNRQSNFDMATGEFLVAGVNANRAAGVLTDWNNIEPRLGFAWRPRGNRTTVIRGGYGVFHDVSSHGGVQGLYQNPPFVDVLDVYIDRINIVHTLATGVPEVPPPDLATYDGRLTIKELKFRQGLIQQWNLNIQRDLPFDMLLTVAYAGTRGSQLKVKGYNLNAAPPGPGNNPPERRPFPQFGSFNNILARGELRYDALQVRAEKRFSHGLYFLTSYTWAKAFTNGLSQGVGVSQGTRYFPQDVPTNSDKGASDMDLRHTFGFSWLYDLPSGNLTGIAHTLLGNWQLSGIYKYRSGFPLGIGLSRNQTGSGTGNRPDRICHGTLPAGERTVERWFDTSCFVAPPPLTWGNSARTPDVTGPPQSNLDFSVLKTFPIREQMDLQFRAEFFNILNHAQFDVPGRTAGRSGFGTITATINTSRQIQFGLKLRF